MCQMGPQFYCTARHYETMPLEIVSNKQPQTADPHVFGNYEHPFAILGASPRRRDKWLMLTSLVGTFGPNSTPFLACTQSNGPCSYVRCSYQLSTHNYARTVH